MMLAIADKSETLHVLNPVMFSKLTIHELKKYVDDMFSVTNTLRNHTIWDPSLKTFTRSQEQESKESLTEKQVTFIAFAEMSSSVMAGSLNFTWDTPCLNETGRLPVLDTCYG